MRDWLQAASRKRVAKWKERGVPGSGIPGDVYDVAAGKLFRFTSPFALVSKRFLPPPFDFLHYPHIQFATVQRQIILNSVFAIQQIGRGRCDARGG